MKTNETLSWAESAATAIVILLVLSMTYLIGYGLYALLEVLVGHRLSLQLPLEARLLGLALMLAGFAVFVEVFRYRHPWDIWVSTSATLMKMVGRRPLNQRRWRTEPFIPNGPYLYVRSPMYLGIITAVFGLGVLESSGPLLLWGLVLTCWYWFLLIPFEERELDALFGESYERYKRQVPKLFPDGRRYRPG